MMSDLPPVYDDEIDLVNLLQTLWDGKWKIILIIAIFLLSVLGFNFYKPNRNFIASTEIKPITNLEADKYRLFNVFIEKIDKENTNINKNFPRITGESLLNTYIDALSADLLEKAIDKFKLINKEDFQNDIDYRTAVEAFAFSIKVLKIKNTFVLRAAYDDKSKWNDLLLFVNKEANNKVQSTFTKRFETWKSIEVLAKEFVIRDLEIKIKNMKLDYERITKDRLAFLSEQAAIARKLGVKKFTFETQIFDSQNTILTNLKTDNPFYFRGYEAIEKEINLIKGRKDKVAFMEGLYELEKKKRAVEQDESLQRAIDLFETTLLNKSDFRATLFKVASTDFDTSNKRKLYYALALLLGGVIGVIYVLTLSAFKRRAYLQNER